LKFSRILGTVFLIGALVLLSLNHMPVQAKAVVACHVGAISNSTPGACDVNGKRSTTISVSFNAGDGYRGTVKLGNTYLMNQQVFTGSNRDITYSYPETLAPGSYTVTATLEQKNGKKWDTVSTNSKTFTINACPAETPDTRKVTICHWDNGQGGKWTSNDVSINSIASKGDWLNGHGGHPNDIWPAFNAKNGDPIAAYGDQTILANGCVVPPTETPVTPTAVTPTVVTPTPVVSGCTDSTAENYDPSANVDDGSCCPVGSISEWTPTGGFSCKVVVTPTTETPTEVTPTVVTPTEVTPTAVTPTVVTPVVTETVTSPPPPVYHYGCMDKKAMNYAPGADRDDTEVIGGTLCIYATPTPKSPETGAGDGNPLGNVPWEIPAGVVVLGLGILLKALSSKK
jgi:hypothetical protein